MSKSDPSISACSASVDELKAMVASVDWYHSVDLGNGLITPGHYDHRPYLPHYRLPGSLTGKSALDIGTASGFFAFELEKRGASVTAVDIPTWEERDLGPVYSPEGCPVDIKTYMREPFEIAREALGSSVEKKFMNVYDISPDTIGEFDLVFCGSLLVHLSDPLKALWNIAGVTREKAIITTVIMPGDVDRPVAELVGYNRGDSWWVPSRRCFELMIASAGFAGIEWVSEFALDYRDGTPGPYHGVIHAYKTGTEWTPGTVSSRELIESQLAHKRPWPARLADRLRRFVRRRLL